VNHFERANRTFIMDALTEAGRSLRTCAWSKLKKGELAALAKRELAGTGWLPQQLRMTSDAREAAIGQPDMSVAAAA
jgi:ParB family chromosome partitioning protein